MAGSKVTKFKQNEPSYNLAKCAICLVWTSRPVTDHCHTHGWGVAEGPLTSEAVMHVVRRNAGLYRTSRALYPEERL